MSSKEKHIKDIERLINKVNSNPDLLNLNEADTESQLIEPLMKALGWNFQEGNIFKKENLANEFPDYTFKINGIKKFILEAKGVRESLYGSYKKKNFVEQAINYAENADCTWAVLTNFKWFRLYCTDKNDNDGLVFELHYTKFLTSDLDRLLYFTKENITNSKIDIELEALGIKTKRIKIDKVLLDDLIHFREILSKDIYKHNDYLKADIVLADEIVQKLLDRFIFIRNCEDRGIESDKLKSYAQTKNIIKKLREAFSDNKRYGYYNSAIFAHNECDKPRVHISDEVLSEIINGLYENKNGIKYNFSEIESDILGSIYEQYLSHLSNRRKKGGLGENLHKKKNQGIYYTPPYIVDYIIKHTLGKSLSDKTKSQIDKIKCLDMACGSGSFLIKCFDVYTKAFLGELNDKELDKPYTDQLALTIHTEKAKDLSPIKRSEIIERNIFGVDLDKQAVEIAQLNLLLKVRHKIKLPFTNITCGNSLLDEDKNEINIGLFEELNDTGKNKFDVIVGNPPYVDIKELDNKTVKQLFNLFSTVENRMNLYSVFIERALSLLKDGGYFGFIIPNSILLNSSYSKIRELLFNKVTLLEIIRLPDGVFEDADVETIIIIFKKNPAKRTDKCKVVIYDSDDKLTSITEDKAKSIAFHSQYEWKKRGVININVVNNELLDSIEENTNELQYYCDVCLGLTPYDKAKGQSQYDIENKVYHSDTPKTKYHKPLLNGEDITRYGVNWGGNNYIKYGNWLGAPREQRNFINPRVLVRQIISGKPLRIYAGYTNKELYNTQIAFNILVKDLYKKDIDLKYLLAIINSNLMSYYHRNRFLDPTKKTFQKILVQDAKTFPIKLTTAAKQNDIKVLVDEIISLTKKYSDLGDVTSDTKKSVLEKIKSLDKKINNKIYDIYNIASKHRQVIDSDFP